MDDVVAGVVSVGNAAGTRSYMLDSENYATLNLLNNFDQTAKGNPLLNSPPLTRAQICLGLLGRIIDYCEASYGTFTGLASIQRNLAASRNCLYCLQQTPCPGSITRWLPWPQYWFRQFAGPALV